MVGSGHEDVDQFFSQTAALLARHEFDSPEDVTKLLDSAHRPDDQPGELHRKKRKVEDTESEKPDLQDGPHRRLESLGFGFRFASFGAQTLGPVVLVNFF